MKSGLYGVVRLDGGPADIADCQALGLAPAPGASTVAAGVDPVDPNAVHTAAGGDLYILLGYLDEPQELAARLGLPQETGFAKLALAAHERFDAEATRLYARRMALPVLARRGATPHPDDLTRATRPRALRAAW